VTILFLSLSIVYNYENKSSLIIAISSIVFSSHSKLFSMKGDLVYEIQFEKIVSNKDKYLNSTILI
jgi:hypothetical protein